MRVKIFKSKANGSIMAPPSKSMAHRALICGALSSGSIITNLEYSNDISATLSCLENMGASVRKDGNKVEIGGLDVFNIKENTELCALESGSTLRFLLPLCMLSENKITITGATRLFERPLSVYEEIAKKDSISFVKDKNSVTVLGKLKGGEYKVPGDISSQFISGLLFALPLINTESSIEVLGNFESQAYIDLTLSALKDFGIEIKRVKNTFYINGNARYQSGKYEVEGDMSNAAFLDGLSLVGGNVEVLGINKNTLQGDKVYLNMFEGLKKGEKCFDLAPCPDLAPVMFALSSLYGGARFIGTRRLRIKESDRGTAMAEELKKLSIETEIYDNEIIIKDGEIRAPKEIINSHNDHRIVMAMALLLTKVGGEIEGAEAVNKSYPNFFKSLKTLGIEMETYDN